MERKKSKVWSVVEMTAKEQRYVRRLEIRIEELEKALDEMTGRSTKDFMQSFEIQYNARAAMEAISEGLELLNKAIERS